MADVHYLTPDAYAERELEHVVRGQVHSNGQYVAVVLDRQSFKRLVKLLPAEHKGDTVARDTVTAGGETFSAKDVTVTLTID